MQQSLIDGIPVFFAEGPGPVSAGLVFGVGRRDESFVRGGLTHLVEHLAMSALGRATIDCNASVNLEVTEFTAIGRGEQVAAFLTAVCSALQDLPVQRLAVEADVLRTESGSAAPPFLALALTELYGATGIGLAGVREPAMRSLTAEHVQEWSARWFCRQNAALWITGPALPDLDLPLPDGVRPPATPVPQPLLRTPSWAPIPDTDRVTLLAEVGDLPALRVTLAVLAERLEDELRHRRGVAYSVGVDRMPLAPGRRLAVVTTDLREGHEGVAANLLWRELWRLADQGPEEAELARDRALVLGFLDDPRADADEARARAESAVTGFEFRSSEQLRAEIDAVTADDVRAAAAAVRDAAFLAVPAPLEPAPPGLEQRPEWSAGEVTGRVFDRKALSGAPRGARLVVGEDGVSLALGDDKRITVRWPDAVGLVRVGEGQDLLVGRDGATLPLAEGDWKDGAEAARLVQQAVPEHLHVVDDEALDEGGVLLFRASPQQVSEAIVLTRDGYEILANGEWTIVVPDAERPLAGVVDDLSSTVGRKTVALVLRRTHADLAYVLYRSGKEIGRHRWGVAHGDPALLAEATGRRDDQVAYLHALIDPPETVLQHAITLLGLPPQVADLVGGERPEGLQRVAGRGIAGGFVASVRGDFEQPADESGLLGRWKGYSRTRPAWFRALNVAGVLLIGLLLWFVATSDVFDGDPARRVFCLVMGTIGLLTCLSRVRPPARPEAPEAEREKAATPTG